MTAYKNRLALMIAIATCIVALAVPAAGRTASIARCDIRALIPFRNPDGARISWYINIKCNGSVTLDHVAAKLQKKRSGGGWRVVAKGHWGPIEIRRGQTFTNYRDCPNRISGTFRTKAIMTKGSNSEKDLSGEVRITCP
jgi:hypothetical protein